MGNKSSNSSRGKTDCIELNKKKEKVKKHLCHPDDENNFKLTEITWWYAMVGSHRIIELTFHCSLCNKNCIVQMDKTTSGKDINYVDHYLVTSGYEGWVYWDKSPKYNRSYSDVIRIFDNASGNYNGVTNNCKDFAKYMWENL